MRKLIYDRKGSVATMTAVLSVPILLAGGTAVDYAMMSNISSTLQISADNAALASAKELALSSSKSNLIEKIAKQYALASLSQGVNIREYQDSIQVSAKISSDKRDVQVFLSLDWKPLILKYVKPEAFPLKASATATLAGSENLCVIALDKKSKTTLSMSGTSSIDARACAIYSNSPGSKGIAIVKNSRLYSSNTYTSGGYKGPEKNFRPRPIVDAPPMEDPLINRVPPKASKCDYKNTKISKGQHTLMPGTYCGGISVTGKANVYLKPGEYILKDGPLSVKGKGIFKGNNVGFVFEGSKSTLTFGTPSTISLSAPRSGALAGILFFENRNYGSGRNFVIQSRNAEKLEGTIYLPNGTLVVSKESRVGQQSDWTAIIANNINIKNGPSIKINANYSGSNIPVPNGVGPQGIVTRLIK